jgi:spore coat polysaccharide biosynthesis protein SpsF
MFPRIREVGLPLVFMDNPLPVSWRMGDLLINALPHPNYDGYDPTQHEHCLDGLEFFLPDSPRRDPARPLRERVERILVTMGGGDFSNLTSLVIAGLREAEFAGFVDVVLGHACPHLDQVRALFTSSGLMGSVDVAVSDLPTRMQQADLGFTALGLTTYEMAYHRLPACIITGHALNTAAATNYVQTYGTAMFLGAGEQLSAGCIAKSFSTLSADLALRTQMAERGSLIGSRHQELTAFFEQTVLQSRLAHA